MWPSGQPNWQQTLLSFWQGWRLLADRVQFNLDDPQEKCCNKG